MASWAEQPVVACCCLTHDVLLQGTRAEGREDELHGVRLVPDLRGG